MAAEEIGRSSAYLKAIHYVRLSCVEQLRQGKNKIFTDNRAAASIVSIGRPIQKLHHLHVSRITFLWKLNGFLTNRTSKRVESILIGKDDWSINPSVFGMIDAISGPHTCDRFASYCNSQIPEYNSRFSSPGSSGVDAFAQSWSGTNNWLYPLVDLNIPVVRKLQSWSRSWYFISSLMAL